jgi:hypothetical protein
MLVWLYDCKGCKGWMSGDCKWSRIGEEQIQEPSVWSTIFPKRWPKIIPWISCISCISCISITFVNIGQKMGQN